MKTYYAKIAVPIGELLIVSDGTHIIRINMDNQKYAADIQDNWELNAELPIIARAIAQFQSYFAGELKTFDLSLNTEGTAFQQRVWRALATIPFGHTVSYGELARRIGNPGASRAVGLANGKNPIAIVLPCHRVVGANGSLTGYGGGLQRKQWLLDMERKFC
ncbi:MAG: methylated-DNA--[protein]-cysteine S-methyltransferase [Leptospiraceae bacterium]|nr:methylated-DNA--[protein]-cysteine S-methyltransferase [Leptospiraceae bacterium]